MGVLGVKIGWVEGLELNVFGLVAGLDLRRPGVKLPGFGRVGFGQDAPLPRPRATITGAPMLPRLERPPTWSRPNIATHGCRSVYPPVLANRSMWRDASADPSFLALLYHSRA